MNLARTLRAGSWSAAGTIVLLMSMNGTAEDSDSYCSWPS
jgi:hypothetical protein